MLVTIWMCTQEWSLICMRRIALTLATCHSAFRWRRGWRGRDLAQRAVAADRHADAHRRDRLRGRQLGAALGLQRDAALARGGRLEVRVLLLLSARPALAAACVVGHASRTVPDGRRRPPRTWPARYRLHKYWSRKPADVVHALVERHARRGGLVLDPFCGSGVAVVEAAMPAGPPWARRQPVRRRARPRHPRPRRPRRLTRGAGGARGRARPPRALARHALPALR